MEMSAAGLATNGGVESRGRRRAGLLKHQLQLLKRKDGDQSRYEIAPISEPLSFEKGFFLFIRALQLLTQHNDGLLVVGLAGPSGAGKTVFSEKVSDFLQGIAIISMDNYNDSSRVIDGNFDDPRLIDFDTLLENVNTLKAGQAVEIPIYDFRQSRRVGYRKVEVPPSRVLVVEGIYALNEKLRPLLDLRVSITGGVHFDLVKRVLRDIDRSGQEPEDIIHQISETVYPMYKAFIEPDLETAHIKIVNKFNPFTGFQNASYILKSPKVISEDQIRAQLSPNHKEFTEQTYDIYLLPPGEDPETCQSYLRMRNRDGRYSLMFEEWVTDGPFIISPRITFEVSVRILGGLMALGYEMGTILKRSSHVFHDDHVTIKLDTFEQLRRCYIQIQGKDRQQVDEIGRQLGLEGTYVPRSYIEQVQLEKLTAEFQSLPEELKNRLIIDDGPASPLAQRWTLRHPNKSLTLPQKGETSPGGRKEGSGSLLSLGANQQSMRERGQSEEGVWNVDGRNSRRDRIGSLDTSLARERERVISLDNPSSSSGLLACPEGQATVLEQLSAIAEKMDEMMVRMSLLENRIPQLCNGATSGTYVRVPSGGSDGGRRGDTGNGCAATNKRPGVGVGNVQKNNSFSFKAGSPTEVISRTELVGDPPEVQGKQFVQYAVEAVGEEMKRINHGQLHMSRQLTILGDMLGSVNAWNKKEMRERDCEGMFGVDGRVLKRIRVAASLCGLAGLVALSSYVIKARSNSSSS
ncbi:hypothetical protein CBR_g31507 [Chara braunii]|uniref:CYTH domain-containing protein n=1 Tax=Chara braunii TaxID=69332 RepID=A0A388LF55_CHABU|nr:hypothetical protein CBR_g31507 [Chara braunii]|eukprot:GBG80950.1 hypothetical protein CBR_g31507 [Chara braunii]